MRSKPSGDCEKASSRTALIGLTKRETDEFRELSDCPKLRLDEFEARVRDARWIELFLKHEKARLQRQRADRAPTNGL